MKHLFILFLVSTLVVLAGCRNGDGADAPTSDAPPESGSQVESGSPNGGESSVLSDEGKTAPPEANTADLPALQMQRDLGPLVGGPVEALVAEIGEPDERTTSMFGNPELRYSRWIEDHRRGFRYPGFRVIVKDGAVANIVLNSEGKVSLE